MCLCLSTLGKSLIVFHWDHEGNFTSFSIRIIYKLKSSVMCRRMENFTAHLDAYEYFHKVREFGRRSDADFEGKIWELSLCF